MRSIKIMPVLLSLIFGIVLINACKKDPVLATLNTTTISDITLNSGTGGGNITSSGGADITARGLCYGTSQTPVFAGTHTSEGTGAGSFTSDLTNLTPNTLYYVRAYATNKVGIAYGAEISFTTSPILVPALTTAAVTSVALTTAVSGGNITADGGGAVTAKGVCWATTTAPTITNSKTTDGTGTGIFTSNLTGLLPSTAYYLRAYATNSAGTSYGNEVSFTTTAIVVPTLTTAAVTAVTLVSATTGGNITADGGGAVTARGVCWASTANPTISNSKTTDDSGSGTFVSNLTGLTPGATYHVRAYATNSAGTAYGNDLQFTTNAIVVPVLTTTAVTSIAYSTAVSGGNITSNGGGTVTVSGVCWATTAAPTTANSKTTDGTPTGAFASNLTGLTPGTVYYVRAYATNSAGTAYGNELSFTTTAIIIPTLTTTGVTSITLTTAVSGGTITANGGGTITTSGICWATTAAPTTANSKTTDGTATGSFSSNMTGLLPGTLYHVRAYATNSAGTAYGNEQTFSTSIAVPTLTTATVTTISQTYATSGGTISSNGGAAISVSGICWSTTANPTTAGTKTTDGSVTGTFASDLTGLTAATTYHVRSYATNSAGTGYGNDISFTTSPIVVPTLTTALVSAIDLTTAVSGGVVTSSGGAAITATGVCWSTSPNPTVSGSKTNDGTTSTFTSTITGLTEGTIYYVRSYATNSSALTGYGNQYSFSTRISDNDGNDYGTVAIGTQLWMAENLRTTRFNDNTAINIVTDATAWTLLSTPAYCWYDNLPANKPLYGALYNWFAVVYTGKNICPANWHVPTDTEYNTMELHIGITPAQIDIWGWRGTDQGSQLKSASGWPTGSNGTNTSGFTALPGGYRFAATGTFNNGPDRDNPLTYFWTATQDGATTAWYRRVDYNYTSIYKGATEQRGGKYVRCIKD